MRVTNTYIPTTVQTFATCPPTPTHCARNARMKMTNMESRIHGSLLGLPGTFLPHHPPSSFQGWHLSTLLLLLLLRLFAVFACFRFRYHLRAPYDAVKTVGSIGTRAYYCLTVFHLPRSINVLSSVHTLHRPAREREREPRHQYVGHSTAVQFRVLGGISH
ncbi:hypothetical protein F4823DRAFT_427485 [Ustulina deusta]|nr:hypothetical protein F4823DRAFT_427485 [Ustulina deusta]